MEQVVSCWIGNREERVRKRCFTGTTAAGYTDFFAVILFSPGVALRFADPLLDYIMPHTPHPSTQMCTATVTLQGDAGVKKRGATSLCDIDDNARVRIIKLAERRTLEHRPISSI